MIIPGSPDSWYFYYYVLKGITNEKKWQVEIVQVAQDYIHENFTKKEASDFALKIIKSTDWESLSDEAKKTVHLLFDLHDSDYPWCPSKDEINECILQMKNL